ncbi:TOPRIM domain protein [Methanococcus vannielii SB]|uniref:DNA primase DnaG n=1 Tax=Methanococcus vannielii (strain ATCC 35089 / DSM 1224 / JCM 13029 / OCM 148 / SB) TaxID=406327 RepID=DNAG_METVS|nr:DNA primase DnaG [Methanococcus vannielii]A6UPT0.1 RecName: Full=DNA primase DnaG [Methanococcus vannielii SB]ABR54502.1 TOPRIM domain protein [Methanococcus vannielii SB]
MDLGTTKYIIYTELIADGYVEKHDVIGAIFGQTEGLLSTELDLRDLQKSGRIGRIDVELENVNGKSFAKITLPSSLDKVETSILAATLETIDRVGPCFATVKIANVEDIRVSKRQYITNRARHILRQLMDEMVDTYEITEEIKESLRTEEIMEYGPENLPCGPNILHSDSIIIVEGRADVLTLLRCGIKNAIAVEGTSVPKTIMEISKKKTTTAFTDGDRGGELILKELLQTCDIDYVSRAPYGKEVEGTSKKEIMKCLRAKVPVEQIIGEKYKNIVESNPVLNEELVEKITPKYIEEVTHSSKEKNELEKTFKPEIEKETVVIEKIKSFEKKTIDADEKTILQENSNLEKKYNGVKEILEGIKNTGLVKFVVDGKEKTNSFKEFLTNIQEIKNMDFFAADMPITQKIVDLLHDKTPIIVGTEIKVTKKPVNLRLFSFDEIME